MIADIAQPLNNDPFILQTRGEAGFFDVFGVVKKGMQRILHAAASGLDPASNAAFADRFAGYTTPGV